MAFRVWLRIKYGKLVRGFNLNILESKLCFNRLSSPEVIKSTNTLITIAHWRTKNWLFSRNHLCLIYCPSIIFKYSGKKFEICHWIFIKISLAAERRLGAYAISCKFVRVKVEKHLFSIVAQAKHTNYKLTGI